MNKTVLGSLGDGVFIAGIQAEINPEKCCQQYPKGTIFTPDRPLFPQ